MAAELKIDMLLDITHTEAAGFLRAYAYPWEILPHIGDMILQIAKTLPADRYEQQENNVWIEKSAVVFPSAYVMGPAIIGAQTQVRHGAFIRGNALIGENCVVGNSTELKNVILFDCVQVPHYNYVGDSILGYKSHMGAGAITSNVKQDKSKIILKNGTEEIETGLKKFGAILGDFVEIGCNTVLNPGSIVGRNSHVYPLSMVRGIIPQDSIYKKQGEIARLCRT